MMTLIRSKDKVKTKNKFCVTPVVGSLGDLLLLENLAAERCRVRRCALIAFRDIKPVVKKPTSMHSMYFSLPQSRTSIQSFYWSGTGPNGVGMSASNIWDNANADDLETLPNTTPTLHLIGM